jgi:hypothetical protein
MSRNALALRDDAAAAVLGNRDTLGHGLVWRPPRIEPVAPGDRDTAGRPAVGARIASVRTRTEIGSRSEDET